MNENRVKDTPNPYKQASLLSRLTFSWLGPLLQLGRKQDLDISDLYTPLEEDETLRLTDELEKEWKRELGSSSKPNIRRAIIRVYGARYVLASMPMLIQECARICMPLLIEQLLRYFNSTMEQSEALMYAGFLCLFVLLSGTLHHPFFYFAFTYGNRVRLAISGLIYRKTLKLSFKSLSQRSSGDIINLLSSDVTRIEQGFTYMPWVISGPLQLVFVIVFILIRIDATFLSGLMVLGLMYCVKYALARYFAKIMKKNLAKTDQRVSMLTEILNSIKIVKMYCWELIFSEKVTNLRNEELRYKLQLNMLQAATVAFDAILAVAITFINIIFFVNITDLYLLPSYTTYSIGFYSKLSFSCGLLLTKAVIFLINMTVSMNRVTEFLMMNELDDPRLSCDSSDYKKEIGDLALSMENFNFSWSDEEFALKNINIRVNKGELAAIIGPVGAGKTSILLGLLGELEDYRGIVRTSGKTFYVSQQAWIFPASLKQNILFGSEYNKEKFDKIVQVCSLKKDLELLAYGADTLIGEKGINLSGGQRARINMARALYADADIYLFDDSLSAVDGTVAKNLIKYCINGYLKDKTRVLVTHQVHHLESATRIHVMKNGEIEASGTYDELYDRYLSFLKSEDNTDFDAQKSQEKEEENDESKPVEPKDLTKLALNQDKFLKEREEAKQEGAVELKSYLTYFKAGWGVVGFVSVALVAVSSQAFIVASDYCLSDWGSKEEKFKLDHETCSFNASKPSCQFFYEFYNQSEVYVPSQGLMYPDRSYNYSVYIGLTITAMVLVFIRCFLFYLWSWSNSKKVYEKLFASVRDTSIRFFELNPIGRILNRFSKDTNNMDEILVFTLYELIQNGLTLTGSLLLSIIINYWMIIPLIVLLIGLFILQYYFIPTARKIKRIDNVFRSPIFVHANSTIEGICTIRSMNMSDSLVKEFDNHCDNHNRAYFGFVLVHRWFGLRLDMLCITYTIVVLFACVLLKDNLGLEPGIIGLLIVYLFQLFDSFQYCIKLYTILDNTMTSIERIVEYMNIPSEPLHTSERDPPDSMWPKSGEIVLNDVSLSYDHNLPDVLKGISVSINSGEKVGIVGRTGAGKSSFFQVLFRMYEPRGTILIDGVDVRKIKLTDLRSKLTIIPQEPVLFSGSIRLNLDPDNKYSDAQIWKALESVSLKSYVQSMTGALDSPISSSGTNLSVGQKQLICLARAILKKTKILIIDEATANVDYQTDSIIQKTIREQFRDCTVLTIAHRLATVVDNDRILCMSEGKVLNFGKPRELLEDQSSVLYDLTRKLSPNEKKLIFELAGCNTISVSNQIISEESNKVEETVEQIVQQMVEETVSSVENNKTHN